MLNVLKLLHCHLTKYNTNVSIYEKETSIYPLFISLICQGHKKAEANPS